MSSRGGLERRWRFGVAAATLAIAAFSVFGLVLLRDVSSARERLGHDVRWMVAVQAVDSTVRRGEDPAEALATVQHFATTSQPLPETLQALDALTTAVTTSRDSVPDATARLTRALRLQTAAISTELDGAWARLSWLVAASLVIALGALVALMAFARASVKLAERRAQQHEAALNESVRTADLLQALAAQVTHDVANPLAFIMSNHRFLCEHFAHEASKHPDVKDALRDSTHGLERIERLVAGLRTASALARSTRPVRLSEALEAALLLVEPRLKRNVTVVRAYESVAGRLVDPVPFMRLMSSVLIDAAERCAKAPRGVVTIGATESSLVISIAGELTRPWAPALDSVAAGLPFDVALGAASSATITVRA